MIKLVVAIAIALASSVAHAETRRIVGILDVHVDGVPAEVATQFQAALEAQVDSKEYWLASRKRVHELMARSTKWTEGCVIGSCLAEVRTQTGADIVLLAALTGADTSFGYVVTLARTDNGNVVGQRAGRCDVCTVSEVIAEATLATVELLSNVPEKLPDDAQQLVLAKRPLEQELRATRSHHRRVGIALSLTGLAVAAAGIGVYVAKDHQLGLATGAAGAGLLLGGVVALTF